MLAETRIEVSYADHKASMVLAAIGIGFGAVVGGLLAGDWTPSDQHGGEAMWWVGAALAVGSITTAAAAVWPRYGGPAEGDGIYYWGQVARLTSYEEMCQRLDDVVAAPADRTRHQLWNLSRIVKRKYSFIRWSFGLVAAAAVCFAVSAALA